jgi:1-acyl-sn-glycerol-3-phosphate acyltransferase
MGFVYRAVRALTKVLVLSWLRIRVEGLENIPADGPCLLFANHQSAFDPLLVQGVCPRPMATMTKSTQFSSQPFRWVLTTCEAFPTRRYRVDAQAIRILLRNLERGAIVCLYPEGERSWDGRLQPLRPGAVRIALKAGVPVIPVGIEGMFDVWPRWLSRPRSRGPVHLRIGTPIHLGRHDTRQAREAAFPEAEARLREALLALSGETPSRPTGEPSPRGDLSATGTPHRAAGRADSGALPGDA